VSIDKTFTPLEKFCPVLLFVKIAVAVLPRLCFTAQYDVAAFPVDVL